LSLGYRSALNAASPPKGKTWDVFILGRVPINEVYVRFAPLATTLVRRRNMSRTAKNRGRGPMNRYHSKLTPSLYIGVCPTTTSKLPLWRQK